VIELRTRTYLVSALTAFSLLAGTVPAGADSIQILSLQTGHSIILDAGGLNRVAVGDGRIAGVVPIGTSQIVVNGKAPGHTTIFVWMGGTRVTYEVTVTEQSFDDIAKVLRAAINEPSVQVVAFNVNLIVRGSVADVAAFNRINEVIDRFKGIKFNQGGGGSGNGVIINAVSIAKPLGNLQDEIAAIPGGHGLRVDADAKGNVVVSGTVRDEAEAQEVLDKVKGLAGPYLAADGKVVDRLGVDQTSQVDVKVYVLEVDKTASSDLGLALGSAQASSISATGTQAFPVAPFTASGSPAFSAATGSGGNNPFSIGSLSRVSLFVPTLNLLLEEGHARVLSSPNLVTQPGQPASFLVGGEIPIPISNGLGTVSISYKEYGVKLDVTPTILGNGSVEAVIKPEISDLDFADGIEINGFTIPALKTSKLSTDVITQNGESVVMGGLLRRQESKNVQKFPLLGDIPILGQLFRSTSYQKTDTDVVFVMTPTIVTK
jgi:Flp pilus assembly secretin CpaC